MPVHVVQQGEHLARIARQYGFRDFRTIWDHPNNSDLKSRRSNPNVLMPGDEMFIPELQIGRNTQATGNVYTYRVPKDTVWLRIVVCDFDNLPMPDTECELTIDGTSYLLQTDPAGRIEVEIAADAEEGVLKIADLDLELPVKVGHLDPSEEDSGWTARLTNLGYMYRQQEQVEDEALGSAIEEFQCDHKLPVTGTMDAATKAKLKELHGC